MERVESDFANPLWRLKMWLELSGEEEIDTRLRICLECRKSLLAFVFFCWFQNAYCLVLSQYDCMEKVINILFSIETMVVRRWRSEHFNLIPTFPCTTAKGTAVKPLKKNIFQNSMKSRSTSHSANLIVPSPNAYPVSLILIPHTTHYLFIGSVIGIQHSKCQLKLSNLNFPQSSDRAGTLVKKTNPFGSFVFFQHYLLPWKINVWGQIFTKMQVLFSVLWFKPYFI